MNRLRGFGIKGLFQKRLGKADDHNKKEDTLTEESRQLPKPAAWNRPQIQKVEQIKTLLPAYGKSLEKRSTELDEVTRKLNSVGEGAQLPPAKLKKQREKVDELATGMTVGLLEFCKDPLEVDLKDALSGIDFKAADWEQALRGRLRAQMEHGGCPTDVASRTTGWVFEQILATGAVCMAAQEETDDKVFGQYVKLAAGAVGESSKQLQSEGYIDQLLSPPTAPEVDKKQLQIQAFLGRLEEIQQPKKMDGEKQVRRQEISSLSQSSRYEVSTHKNKFVSGNEDTSVSGPSEQKLERKSEPKSERKSEHDGDSSKSEIAESPRKKNDLKQEVSGRSEIARHEVSTHKNKSALSDEDTSVSAPHEQKLERKSQRKSEQDGDSAKSKVDEANSETSTQ